MKRYSFKAKYDDGLMKKGILKESELESNVEIWIDETKNTDGDKLIFLQIKELKN